MKPIVIFLAICSLSTVLGFIISYYFFNESVKEALFTSMISAIGNGILFGILAMKQTKDKAS